MSKTHGGAKAKEFRWSLQADRVLIRKTDGKQHEYSLEEIATILKTVSTRFGPDWFPLANNVQKLSEGTEVVGLGSLIYGLHPGNTFHAQGASYLGVSGHQKTEKFGLWPAVSS